MQTGGGKIGDTGEDVGQPGLGIDVVEATYRDHRQHDGGTIDQRRALNRRRSSCAFPGEYHAALSLALLLRQIPPSSRKRAKSAQRLSMLIGLSTSAERGKGFALAEQPGVYKSLNSGLLFSWRTARRSSALRPLMALSISNSASRRLTAASAIGEMGLPLGPSRALFARSASRRSPAAHGQSKTPA